MSTHIHRLSHGFTLIEIIVVISIVMIFAAVSAGGFSAMRRTVALDISADTIVNTLNALRGESQRGTTCEGMLFQVDKAPEKITAPYANATRTCELSSLQKSPFTWSRDSAVSRIQNSAVESGVAESDQTLTILFAPPRGTMTAPTEEKTLTLTASNGRSRTITINPLANTINASKP